MPKNPSLEQRINWHSAHARNCACRPLPEKLKKEIKEFKKNNMAENSAVKLGRYRHYKGKNYQVIGVAKHSETLEELVVYKALYNNKVSKLWVRPKKMFLEEVEVEGKKQLRFKYLGRD